MLTKEQTQTLKLVYNRFLSSEADGWSEIDNLLEILDFLTDKEIVTESEILRDKHKNKTMGCPYSHSSDHFCPVLEILDSVDSILMLYRETKNLHPKNRYILAYYLTLTNMNMIVELN